MTPLPLRTSFLTHLLAWLSTQRAARCGVVKAQIPVSSVFYNNRHNCRIHELEITALLPAAQGTMVQHRTDSFTDNVTHSGQSWLFKKTSALQRTHRYIIMCQGCVHRIITELATHSYMLHTSFNRSVIKGLQQMKFSYAIIACSLFVLLLFLLGPNSNVGYSITAFFLKHLDVKPMELRGL